MAKRTKTVKRASPEGQADLRRWCIEMAMKWPVIGPQYPGAQSTYLPATEANIIDRANRILVWVTNHS